MTISSYTELKTAIANYTGRADLSGRDDEFIDSVEAIFSRRLRIRAMEASTTSTMVSGTATLSLPSGFLESRTFTFVPVTGSVRDLIFKTPEQCEAFEYTYSAAPVFYTYVGGAIRLYPTPDDAYSYTLRYYATITALSGSATTNYYITNHPDLYLYGCLAEAFSYLLDTDNAIKYKTYFERLLNELIRNDARERFPHAPRVEFDVFPQASQSNILTDDVR